MNKKINLISSENEPCQTCYRIACKQCDWVASEGEVSQIQQGLLTSCPLCGWKPGNRIDV